MGLKRAERARLLRTVVSLGRPSVNSRFPSEQMKQMLLTHTTSCRRIPRGHRLAGRLAEIRREPDRRPSSPSHWGVWWLFLPQQEMLQMSDYSGLAQAWEMRTWPKTFPRPESRLQVPAVWLHAVLSMKKVPACRTLHLTLPIKHFHTSSSSLWPDESVVSAHIKTESIRIYTIFTFVLESLGTRRQPWVKIRHMTACFVLWFDPWRCCGGFWHSDVGKRSFKSCELRWSLRGLEPLVRHIPQTLGWGEIWGT